MHLGVAAVYNKSGGSPDVGFGRDGQVSVIITAIENN